MNRAGATPYADLEPSLVLESAERCGHLTDGHLLALNSYENRVYQIGREDRPPIVAKFYRPGRWPDEAILEEHAFAIELAAHDIPVVAPLKDEEGRTLHEHAGYRFALFPRVGGRAPELEGEATLTWLGRLMARLHNVGATKPFRHRPKLTVARFGDEPVHRVLESNMLPAEIAGQYRSVAGELLDAVRACFDRAGRLATLRLHGDCHPGNMLWTERGPLFVDLDDCLTGPAIQDLWMLISGDRESRASQLARILDGYTQFREFDPRELHLIEALRGLRMLHQAGWILARWRDPAFPAAFPWIGEPRWWEDHVASLREQIAQCHEPPLAVW